MGHPLPLHGVRVAIVVADGFEQIEMTRPRQALQAAGATAEVVSPRSGSVRGWNGDEGADDFAVEVPIAQAKPTAYDALLLPGGIRSADRLRVANKAILFVHAMQIAKKPIAAIGHAPWILVETDYVRGRRVTSGPSLRTDLANAGADWVDQPAVTDGLLVTGRKRTDVSHFSGALLELFVAKTNGVARAS